MAPKFKFTRAEITDAALQVVRRNGIGALTARAIAQPVFTCFSTMAEARGAVRSAAESIYDGYVEEGLRAEIPFYGFGMQYIRFAREEPELYRLLFLTHDAGEKGAMDAMRHSLDYVNIVELAEAGEFGNVIIDGPLDVKTSCEKTSGDIKGIVSPGYFVTNNIALGADLAYEYMMDDEGHQYTLETGGFFRLYAPRGGVRLYLQGTSGYGDSGLSKYYSIAMACLTSNGQDMNE